MRTPPTPGLDCVARSDPRPAHHARRTGSDLMNMVLSGAPGPSPGVLPNSLPLPTGSHRRAAGSGRRELLAQVSQLDRDLRHRRIAAKRPIADSERVAGNV